MKISIFAIACITGINLNSAEKTDLQRLRDEKVTEVGNIKVFEKRIVDKAAIRSEAARIIKTDPRFTFHAGYGFRDMVTKETSHEAQMADIYEENGFCNYIEVLIASETLELKRIVQHKALLERIGSINGVECPGMCYGSASEEVLSIGSGPYYKLVPAIEVSGVRWSNWDPGTK